MTSILFVQAMIPKLWPNFARIRVRYTKHRELTNVRTYQRYGSLVFSLGILHPTHMAARREARVLIPNVDTPKKLISVLEKKSFHGQWMP